MFKNLCPWMFGEEPTLKETLNLAKNTGYEGIEIRIERITQLVQEKSIDYVKNLFSEAEITPAVWELSWWNSDEEQYKQRLERLPLFAKVSSDLDCRRAFIWVPSYSNEREYPSNFQWHINRLRPIIRILKDYNLRLGLEWQGTPSLRVDQKYEFIHDMKGMLELCEEIDGENVGLVLDTWHWYTSNGTLLDIRKLKNEEVVYVHINDAPAGIPMAELKDLERAIPGETGVIDLVGFFKCLKEISYDGPFEPSVPRFGNEKLKRMSFREAVKTCSDALDQLLIKAGIA